LILFRANSNPAISSFIVKNPVYPNPSASTNKKISFPACLWLLVCLSNTNAVCSTMTYFKKRTNRAVLAIIGLFSTQIRWFRAVLARSMDMWASSVVFEGVG